MIISLIVALTTNHVIGKKNVIPWYFPIDIKWFKYHTLHKPIIMGRKTFESIGKKPLLNRLNIVLTRHGVNYDGNDVLMVDKPDCALSLIKDTCEEVMVIGGSAIYSIFLPYAQRLYLTYVNNVVNIDGDSWFPDYDVKEWKSVFNSFYKVNDDFFYYLNFKILERF